METMSPSNHVFAPVFTDGSSVEVPSLETRNCRHNWKKHRFHFDFTSILDVVWFTHLAGTPRVPGEQSPSYSTSSLLQKYHKVFIILQFKKYSTVLSSWQFTRACQSDALSLTNCSFDETFWSYTGSNWLIQCRPFYVYVFPSHREERGIHKTMADACTTYCVCFVAAPPQKRLDCLWYNERLRCKPSGEGSWD